MTGLTRRELLCGLSLPAGIVIASGATRELRSSSSQRRSGFDPTVNGFGFDNYSTGLESPNPSEVVSEDDVRVALTAHGSEALQHRPLASSANVDVPEVAVRTIVGQLYANAARLFGTKGHCYGMVSAAQWYFEEPEALPLDRDSASEIEDVNDPLESASWTPVRDDVERLHRIQFLDPESWLERRALLRPEWIDYRSQERELRAAIDTYGSAGVTLTSDNVLRGHYVLLYDYEVNETDVVFAVYDPNDGADEYAAGESHLIGIDTGDYEPLLGTYEGAYDRFLFNRNDRAVRARARERARANRVW